MYSPEVPQKSEFYEQFVPNKMTTTNIQQSFLPHSNYSDYSDYQGPPLNIYNNYNPNFHHHHYYYPNFDNYQGYQTPLDHSWMRKFDCENQKEYFIANTPSPAECCDFEVPQQQQINSLKPSKPLSEPEKFFFDTPKSSKDIVNNNFGESCESVNWDDEKSKVVKDEKNNLKVSKGCKSPKDDDYGERK
jgi:hypothetical protein